MANLVGQKWCTYCQADSHNDSECWCTRPVDWSPEKYRALSGAAIPRKRGPLCCGEWDSLAGKCEDCPHEEHDDIESEQ